MLERSPRVSRPWRRHRLPLAAAIAAIVVLVPLLAHAHPDGSFPRTFNLDWRNDINATDDSRYDVICISARVQNDQLDSLRALNPSIVRLLSLSWYVFYNAGPSGHPAQWGPFDAEDERFGFDRKYWDLLENNDWWVTGVDSQGARFKGAVFWDTWTGNFSSKCPPNAQGQRLCDVFADFLIDELLPTRNVDGFFFDNCWDHPRHLHWQMWGACPSGTNCPDPSVPRTPETEFAVGFDLDHDGVADDPDSLAVWWFDGVSIIMERLRERMGPDFVLVGNGPHHYTAMNGAMYERFPRLHGRRDPEPNPIGYRWYDSMFSPKFGYLEVWQDLFAFPRYNFIDTEWAAFNQYQAQRTSTGEQFKRFTLGSTLLGDGYFTRHGATYTYTWWEPEYDLQLGWPTGAAYPVDVGGVELWKRDFTGGVVWVNPTTIAVAESPSNPALQPRDAALIQGTSAVGDRPVPAGAVRFERAWPNPSVDRSWITFRLPVGASASLRIFDLRGRLVRELWEGVGTGEPQTATWDGRHERGWEAPPGIYFASLSSSGVTSETRLVRLP